MAKSISLALVIHNHQPVGNFGWVIAETYDRAYLPMMSIGILALLARGDLLLDPAFDFGAELPHLLALCSKYADREMDLADACLVRMTELTSRCKIWTVDREDFAIYRRHSRQMVPCMMPS